MDTFIRSMLRHLEADVLALQILAMLNDQPPGQWAATTEIAEHVGRSLHVVRGLLIGLRDRGLVQRQRIDGELTAYEWRATPHGAVILDVEDAAQAGPLQISRGVGCIIVAGKLLTRSEAVAAALAMLAASIAPPSE